MERTLTTDDGREATVRREAIIQAGMLSACELAAEGNYGDATKFMEIVTQQTDKFVEWVEGEIAAQRGAFEGVGV